MSRDEDKLMEKKIKPTPKETSALELNEEKMITITILIALAIIAALLVNVAFFTPTNREEFEVIYILDSEKTLENFPTTVILGENSTFTLWIGVENHRNATTTYTVQLKMDDGESQVDPSPSQPIQSFTNTLATGELWEFPVTINLEQPGSHRIIFELWRINEKNAGNLEYTGNWVFQTVTATQTQ